MSYQRILVCGGTGFIGRNLVEEIIKQKKHVNILFHKQLPENFKKYKKFITVFKGDLLDKNSLSPAIDNADIVINLVGSFFDDIFSLNVLATFNLLEACKDKNKKLIFISSQSIYGECSGKPFIESRVPKPVTEYGLMKYVAENICKIYSHEYNLTCIVLRLSNVYGPGQKTGVMSNFTDNALKNKVLTISGDGKQKRDFVFVDDVVDAIIRSMDRVDNMRRMKHFEIFNIGGPKTHTLLDVISIIEKLLKKNVKVRFIKPKKNDIKFMRSSHSKAKKSLNYEPKISLEHGIEKIINEKNLGENNG